MEDSFRSKSSYSGKYSDSTSSDLMKQLSDQTISSNSSKKSKKHTPHLDSKPFSPIDFENPHDTNNQQANYGYNQQQDKYVDKNWKQPPPRFAQNQNNNYQRNQQNWGDNYNNNYQNNQGGNYAHHQNQGGYNNNNYNRNKNYNNNSNQYQNKKSSKQPYQKYNNNYRKPYNSNTSEDTSSLKLINPDTSSFEDEPQNRTEMIADHFDISIGLISFKGGDVDDDLGDLLDGLTTESDTDSASQSSSQKKPRERSTYSLQGMGAELHNISRNRIIITRLLIEIPCSGCTLLSYQDLKRKIDEPWMSRRKICKVCGRTTRSYIETKYTDWNDDFENGQLMIGKLETAGASVEKTTVNNVRQFDFEIRCAGCQTAYPFHCTLFKDPRGNDQDLIIDENMSCRQWNCYKLMVIRIKKIQLQKISNMMLNVIPEVNDKEDSEDL